MMKLFKRMYLNKKFAAFFVTLLILASLASMFSYAKEGRELSGEDEGSIPYEENVNNMKIEKIEDTSTPIAPIIEMSEQEARKIAPEAFQSLSQPSGGSPSFFGGIFSFFQNVFSGIITVVQNVFNAIGGFFQSMFNGIGSLFSNTPQTPTGESEGDTIDESLISQKGYASISESDGKIIITGKFVRVSLFKEVVTGNITQENLKTWVENLDVAYVSIAKLNGGRKPKIQRNEPYMDIISFEENEMKAKGAWANAGQPIQWSKPWIADELRNINMKPGFYSWGIIHEISHNFDNGWRGMYSLSWDSEFYAVMVPYYVLQKNGWNPNLYDRGRALLVDQLDKAHTLESKYNWKALEAKFVILAEKEGLEPFEYAFKYLKNDPGVRISSMKDKFELFLDAIDKGLENKNSSLKVRSLFTPKELDYIRSYLSRYSSQAVSQEEESLNAMPTNIPTPTPTNAPNPTPTNVPKPSPIPL